VHAGGKNDVDGFGEFALFYCSLKLYVIASHLRMLWPQIMDLRTDRVVRGGVQYPLTASCMQNDLFGHTHVANVHVTPHPGSSRG
jgi:hypothetical protein